MFQIQLKGFIPILNCNKLVALLPLLLGLYNLVIKEKRLPDPWKISVVIPLFKKGDASLCENYRPISLENCLGKIMEQNLNKRLELRPDETQILREEQGGFRKGYSPSDRMFVLNALIKKHFKGKGKLYVAFLDLSRAFDNVDRIILFRTLLGTGIPPLF